MTLEFIWVGFCKLICCFAPQRVDSNNMRVQDIRILSQLYLYKIVIENSYTSPKHKGNLVEKQTVLSSMSKGFLSMHISHWIKIALNPGLSKLLILEKPVSSGQRRQKWRTIKKVFGFSVWNLKHHPGLIFGVQQGTNQHWATECKEQSKHDQGVGCPLLLSAFLSSDQAKFLFQPNWKLWKITHREKTKKSILYLSSKLTSWSRSSL